MSLNQEARSNSVPPVTDLLGILDDFDRKSTLMIMWKLI